MQEVTYSKQAKIFVLLTLKPNKIKTTQDYFPYNHRLLVQTDYTSNFIS